MSSVNSRKDTTSADILNQIRKHIIQNQVGRTASNDFTKTHIIPANDTIAITDTVTNTALGLAFKITNDVGGGVSATEKGEIEHSVITEPNSAQITNDSGDGSGIMAPGIIDSVTALVQEISVE